MVSASHYHGPRRSTLSCQYRVKQCWQYITHEQAAAAWKPVRRVPEKPSSSRFRVLISLPKQPMSENPRSSATMTRKFGLFAIAAIVLAAGVENVVSIRQ